jgi:hypothetical protein
VAGASTATTTVDLPDDAMDDVAAALWNPTAVAAVAKGLQSPANPASAGELLTLAATIPSQVAREAEFAALSAMYDSGPAPLNALGLFKGGLRDPGLVVVLKSLPRIKPDKNKDGEYEPLEPWSAASRDAVVNLRDQLRSGSGSLTQIDPDELPVKLHRNATAEVAGMLTLPGTAGTALQTSAPSETKVYYARTTFTPQRDRDRDAVLDHYESKASGLAHFEKSMGLLWIDGVKTASGGMRRSMDVLIQAPNAGGGAPGFSGPPGGFGGPPGGFAGNAGGGDEVAGDPISSGSAGQASFGGPPGAGGPGGGTGYTIEILIVETADPKAAAGASSTAAASP